MNRRVRIAVPLAVIALAVTTVAGCNRDAGLNTAVSMRTPVCASSSTSQQCALEMAEALMGELTEDAVFLSVASEYALALYAAGRGSEAAAVLRQAVEKAVSIPEPDKAAAVLADIAASAGNMGDIALVMSAWKQGEVRIASIEAAVKKSDLSGKFLSARAATGDAAAAGMAALAMPEDSDDSASFKARTLREIAAHQAKAGNFDDAQVSLNEITMGLSYYAATAHSDVAAEAEKAGEFGLANQLLVKAEKRAREQDNGYFIAGALRDIASVYARLGDSETAMQMFEDAKQGARAAESYQEKARAMSRIGTSLADQKMFVQAAEVFPEAVQFAEQEEQASMRTYSFYEIAGSAAFSGDFALANQLIARLPDEEFLSADSLAAVAKRDLAWGLARHGMWNEAIQTASSISTRREKIQALSRLVRLSYNPDMEAVPRYL